MRTQRGQTTFILWYFTRQMNDTCMQVAPPKQEIMSIRNKASEAENTQNIQYLLSKNKWFHLTEKLQVN